MKQWIKFSVPVAVGLIGLSASAVPITGTVRMSGNVTLDSQNLASATTASFNNAGGGAGNVSSGTGAFAGTANAGVNFTGFKFAPLASQSTPVNPLWSFVSGGLTYTFALNNISDEGVSSVGGNQFLIIDGTGTLNISGGGFDATPANWSFTVTDTSGGTSGSFIFGFAQSDTSTPDGGMTVMMLGVALTGLGLIKRKLA